jgi:hypothetical protein
MNNPLSYLQGDSQGPKRDLIARYYYQVAQGDPNSSPVAFAVLLDACAEQLAKVPEELRQATADFKTVVAEGQELERRLIGRMEHSNGGLIIALKDETRRAHDALREIVILANTTMDRAEKMAKAMQPVITMTEQVTADLRILKSDLRVQQDSVAQVAQATGTIKAIHEATQEFVKHLVKQARFNWVTIGFMAGIAFNGIANQLQVPPWVPWVALALGTGLIQWLARRSWDFIRKQAEKLSSTAKP